jgi:hypothetical protein
MTPCTVRRRASLYAVHLPTPMLPKPSPAAQAILDLFR